MRKKKRGRPVKSDKLIPVSTNISKDEKSQIEKLANRSRGTRSTTIRMAIVDLLLKHGHICSLEGK